MSRFPNKLVMGGSDRESTESEDEYYMPGQEMVNLYAQQCMYNATMYNVMMQNMMPCVPMPCIPAYGYPMPYPSIMSNRPVNHAMSAGHYYEKGGRSRQSRKSRSKGDGNAYRMPHHRQHRVVSRHQYYEPSSESDSADEYLYTGEKGVQACRSVNPKMTADKSYHHNDTLRHHKQAPVTSVYSNGEKSHIPCSTTLSMDDQSQSLLQSGMETSVQSGQIYTAANQPLTHQTDNSETYASLSMGTAADRTIMPLKSLNEQHRNSGISAANDNRLTNSTLVDFTADRQSDAQTDSARVNVLEQQPNHQNRDVTSTSNNHTVPVTPSSHAEYQSMNPVDSHCSDISSTEDDNGGCSSTTLLVQNQCDQAGDVMMNPDTTNTCTQQRVENAAKHLPLCTYSVTGASGDNGTKGEEEVVRVVAGRGRPRGGSNEGLGKQDCVGFYRDGVPKLKSPQSLHSLRKMWAEWETKYRPPPVSVNTPRCW